VSQALAYSSKTQKGERTLRKIERPSKTLLLCTFLMVFPLASFAAPDDSAHQTASDATSLYSSSASAEKSAWNDTADVPAPQRGKSEVGRIGVGVRLSTLGAGAEVGFALTDKLNVRGGFNIFQYSRGFDHDGITYKGQLNLRSGEAHLDWYPLGHTFHLSPGLLVYNGNGATATANVPGGSTFTLGGTTYSSDPTNPITGTGKLDFVKAAPTAMFGFGNLVPQSRHFTYNFELGAVFQGSARTKLNLTGNACDFTGLNCVNAATDPTVQQNVIAEQTKINNKLSPFKYYPVISFGFGYRF
jgi:hypothetical protein